MDIFLIIFTFFCIHVIGSYIPSRLSKETIFLFNPFFKVFSWELPLYEKIKIKKWKDKLPDGGDWVRGGVKKNSLNIRKRIELEKFVLETKKAELSHSLQIIITLMFLSYIEPLTGIILFFYSLIINAPFIFIQRYNRERVNKFVVRFEDQQDATYHIRE